MLSKTKSRFHDGKDFGVLISLDFIYCRRSLMYESWSMFNWGSSNLSGFDIADLYCKMEE